MEKIKVLLLIYLFNLAQANADINYKISPYGCSQNVEAGFVSFLSQENNIWNIKKITFNGKLIEGPTVLHAIIPISLREGIVVPCSDGKVIVFSEDFESAWSFCVDSPKNIAGGIRFKKNNQIALITIDVAKQKKFIESFEINFKLKKAQNIQVFEIPWIGGIFLFSESLWLFNSDEAIKIQN
jgi:hypothetical protein